MTNNVEELVNNNLRLVGLVIKQFNSTLHAFEIDDIYSAGSLGLLQAARKFDPSKGYKFSTFAMPCIRNQIFMFIRKADVRRRNVGLNISLDDIILPEREHRDAYRLGDLLTAHDSNFKLIEKEETLRELSTIIAKRLAERDQKLIRYRYFDKLSQQETAKRLKLSQAQISRSEKKILKKLREELEQCS